MLKRPRPHFSDGISDISKMDYHTLKTNFPEALDGIKPCEYVYFLWFNGNLHDIEDLKPNTSNYCIERKYWAFADYEKVEVRRLIDKPEKKIKLPVLHEEGIKPSKRFNILHRDGFCCSLCGKSAKDGAVLEVDHKHPKSKGGGNSEDNLWTLCWDCNRGKVAKVIDFSKMATA